MCALPLFLLAGCLGLDQKGLTDTDTDAAIDELPGDGGDPGTQDDTGPGPITGDSGTTPGDTNQAPVADAGEDQEVEAGSVVTLDGSESYDPDPDDYLTFYWEVLTTPAGSTASLINEDRDDPQIYMDLEGSYEIQLTVSDGALESTDLVYIDVYTPNEAPVAVAGPDQTVTVGSSVVLDGTGSYDPNGDPLTFAWEMTTAPSGSFAALSDPVSPAPRFTADTAGTYEIRLIVSDGEFESSADTVRVSAQSSGGGGTGGTGGGGSSSCLSCSEPTQQFLLRKRSLVGLASGPGLVFLPIGMLLWRRKRART